MNKTPFPSFFRSRALCYAGRSESPLASRVFPRAFYVAPPRWRSPARYQEKPGCTSTVRTRVLRRSELSAPFLGARGGRYFVYLSHAGEEVFRRFWGFPPPINDSSLADSCRPYWRTTQGFIIPVSLSTVHQFDCETSAQFALL